MTPNPRGARAWVVAGVLIGMTGFATSPMLALYDAGTATWLVIGAAAGAVLISTVLRRAPAALAAPVSLVALAGYLLLASRVTATGTAMLPATADALRNGVARLIGSLLPLPTEPDTVALPVVIVWLAALGAAELAVRAGRTLAGYAPPTIVYLLALGFAGPHGTGPALWRPLGFAALGALGLALTASPLASLPRPGPAPGTGPAPRTGPALKTGPASGTERAPGTVPAPMTRPATIPAPAARRTLAAHAAAVTAAVFALVFVAAAAAAPAVAHLVTRTPVDVLRVPPPLDDTLDENPLIRLSGWALNPDEPLFGVTVTGATGAVPLRLAVLERYDGVTWQVDGDYRPAGTTLPAPTAHGHGTGRAVTIDQTVTIDQLDGHLIPAAATPTAISGIRVAEDTANGTLIRPDGLYAGLTYHVTSAGPIVDADALASADVPSGPAVAGLLDVAGSPPPDMLRLATQLGAQSGDPYDRASAISAFLREHYRLVANAPSGHAYPNLAFFLFAPREAGGQRGTSEQFAAAFAVLGRMLGLPTRVVVGFRAQPGTTTIRGADALAWPEVLFDGVGWVAFDPLPTGGTPPRALEQDFAPLPPPSASTPPSAPGVTVTPTPATSTPAAVAAPGGSGTPATLLTLVAILVPLPALVILVIGVRRARDRRWLARATPAQRVGVAWRELLTALRRAGHPAPGHLSATEVAVHATACVESAADRGVPLRFAVPPLDDLVGLVNTVTFAHPDAPVDDRAAWLALAQSRAYVTELRARRPWWRRHLPSPRVRGSA